MYREELTSAHPFVVIRDDVSADVLGTARPFLMSCIRMVASFRSLRSMQGQMYELKQQISDRVLLRSERSLDLLSGLVVMLGWYQHHCLVHTQLNNFVALATTMVADMRLNRKPGWLERTKLMVNDLENVEERTNEQKRLLLGAWYLSSCVSTGLDATECTPLTAYMRQCLKEVEADAECESDILMVYLVKLQDILDRTARLSRQINDDDEDETPKGPVKAPFSAYVTALTAEFDALLNKMPFCVKNDDNMRIRINSVRIRLHEPPKLSADVLLSMSRYFAETPPAGLSSPLDSLYRSHLALKTWYNDWLSMPAAANRTTPMPVVLDAITAITALGRWAKMAASGSIARIPVKDALPLDPSGNWNNRSATTPASSASAGGYSVPSPSDPESNLVQAIATLKTRLATQPDLCLDVTEILGQLGQAMEQASAALAADSEDPPRTGHDWWSLSAIKIRIAQVKLEHWTAMIEDQESETGDEDGYDVDGGVVDRVKTLDQADKPSDDLELLGDVSTQEAGWTSTASTGVFDSLGWMEGLGDWGAFMTHLR
ncbi:hypothetical protein CTRI78_v002418 [Colletotrichum trifolii]|uniref:Uncharacterized protein n=1 Tax=Colletotrichum trifolii TaxID=5466 RepID=A0A4R8RMK4_COLTR|nr:hypothetical protein CTRI78_v002418 [Colletotrichum trifolii]